MESEARRSFRYDVNWPCRLEWSGGHDLLHLEHLSRHGVSGRPGVFRCGRGAELLVDLPALGRSSARVVWLVDERLGLEFVTPLTVAELLLVLDAMNNELLIENVSQAARLGERHPTSSEWLGKGQRS